MLILSVESWHVLLESVSDLIKFLESFLHKGFRLLEELSIVGVSKVGALEHGGWERLGILDGVARVGNCCRFAP